MDVVFTRINSHKYSSIAIRDDGVRLAIPGYGPSKPVPHDLVHFLTEDELAINSGFWGCVAAGAIFRGMEVVSGQLRHDALKKSQELIRGVSQQNAEAESLAALVLNIWREKAESNWPRIQEMQKAMWQPAHPSHLALTHNEITRILSRIHKLEQAWQALPDGQTLTAHWTVKLLKLKD